MTQIYFDLVRRVPLRPIRSEAELDRAIDMINELIDRPERNAGAQDYLDVLSDLVEAYEEMHYPMPSVASDAEALRLLIEAKGITQQELAKAVGIANSTISAILHGQRRARVGVISKH